MPTDELLHDDDMDRALRDLLPAMPRPAAREAAQRDDLLMFIDTGRRRAEIERHPPRDAVHVSLGSMPQRRRSRAVMLACAAAAALALTFGLGAIGQRPDVASPATAAPPRVGVPATTGDAEIAPPPVIEDQRTVDAMLRNASLSDLDRRTCPVVGVSPTNFDRRVEIDCGIDDGLRVGMPVVDAAGLVGKITTVALDTSVVMLVTDPQYSVMVSVAGADGPLTGVLEGEGADRLPQVRLTDARGEQVDAAAGMPVTSAGGTVSLAPPGLPIGRVSSVGESSPILGIALADDFAMTEELTVLLYVSVRERPMPG